MINENFIYIKSVFTNPLCAALSAGRSKVSDRHLNIAQGARDCRVCHTVGLRQRLQGLAGRPASQDFRLLIGREVLRIRWKASTKVLSQHHLCSERAALRATTTSGHPRLSAWIAGLMS